jgi:hypothetical protein
MRVELNEAETGGESQGFGSWRLILAAGFMPVLFAFRIIDIFADLDRLRAEAANAWIFSEHLKAHGKLIVSIRQP